MAVESRATTIWEGGLADGRGTTEFSSGALPEVEVTWGRRVERTSGTTSPEELLAAAQASCFCMALSHALGDDKPTRLEAHVTISFVPGEGVKSSRIVVEGTVPGIDAQAFEAAVADASRNCPISAALAGNVEISHEATLSS